MLALVGESRFPIYYSPDGQTVLGIGIKDTQFKEYVSRLRGRGIAIKTMQGIQFKRRFVINGNAINPTLSLQGRSAGIFVYPELDYEPPMNDVYALGLVLDGMRQPVFSPLVLLRKIEQREAVAFDTFIAKPKAKAEIKTANLELMIQFAQAMGLTLLQRQDFADRTTALTLNDSEIHGYQTRYQVLLSTEGKVMDTNVCFSTDDPIFLSEFIMLTRGRNHLTIYSDNW